MIPKQALEFIRRATKNFPNLNSVILHGSFPREEYDDRSDVDMLLIFESKGNRSERRSEAVRLGNQIIREMEEEGERTWDFQFLITSNLEELDETLKNEIRAHGIQLYSKPKIGKTNLNRRGLFKYSVKDLEPAEKVKFYRALKHSGLAEYRVGSALLVPGKEIKNADSLLKKFGIEKSKLRIYSER